LIAAAQQGQVAAVHQPQQPQTQPGNNNALTMLHMVPVAALQDQTAHQTVDAFTHPLAADHPMWEGSQGGLL
jgi:hypothetical protein